MSRKQTRRWVDRQLEGLGRSPRNALTATFQIAILRVLSLRMTQRVHEEPLTGFLLGAFASLAPVCSAAFADEEEMRCSWQYFPKSGSGELTEPSSGADFALIVEGVDKLARLAIFQAKRENKSPPNTFKIHQVREPPPEVKDAAKKQLSRATSVPQFLRLLKHAKKVAGKANVPSPLRKLHWVHYLIYSPMMLRCVSINQLGVVKKFYNDYEDDEAYPDPGPICLDRLHTQNFLWLLTCGADPSCKGADLKGWLEIPHRYVKAVRDSLISFTDVYVAHHGPSPKLENDPGSDPSPSPDDIAKLACKALLRLDDVPAGYPRIHVVPEETGQEIPSPSKKRGTKLG